jgi:hypothetical protein
VATDQLFTRLQRDFEHVSCSINIHVHLTSCGIEQDEMKREGRKIFNRSSAIIYYHQERNK